MNTQAKLIVIGGTKNTRNALHSQITKELIEKLMNETYWTDAAVAHTFTSIWDVPFCEAVSNMEQTTTSEL